MRLLVLATLAAVALTGCQGGASPSAASSPATRVAATHAAPRPRLSFAAPARRPNPRVAVPDACAALTADDVHRFFATMDAVVSNAASSRTCIYPDKHGKFSISLEISRASAIPDWAHFVALSTLSSKTIPGGLGSQALTGYFTATGFNSTEVAWRTLDLQYDLIYNEKIAVGGGKANLVPLAQRVAARTGS